nr:unnamed protein product [Digitaria exilis]
MYAAAAEVELQNSTRGGRRRRGGGQTMEREAAMADRAMGGGGARGPAEMGWSCSRPSASTGRERAGDCWAAERNPGGEIRRQRRL